MTIEKFSRLGTLALGALVATIMMIAGDSINHIGNGGALDNSKQLLSDLRADILPVPMFLVAAFANASTMILHRDSCAINDKRLATLEEQFWEADAKWAASVLGDRLKTDLAANARKTGKAFWDEINLSFKPAAHRAA